MEIKPYDGEVISFQGENLQKLKSPYIGKSLAGVQDDVADRFEAMARDYQALTGEPIKINDAFRTHEQQAEAKRLKPFLAASAGLSLHEEGKALDIDTTQAHELDSLGLLTEFGFHRPMMGQGKSGKYEPWHIEPVSDFEKRANKIAGPGRISVKPIPYEGEIIPLPGKQNKIPYEGKVIPLEGPGEGPKTLAKVYSDLIEQPGSAEESLTAGATGESLANIIKSAPGLPTFSPQLQPPPGRKYNTEVAPGEEQRLLQEALRQRGILNPEQASPETIAKIVKESGLKLSPDRRVPELPPGGKPGLTYAPPIPEGMLFKRAADGQMVPFNELHPVEQTEINAQRGLPPQEVVKGTLSGFTSGAYNPPVEPGMEGYRKAGEVAGGLGQFATALIPGLGIGEMTVEVVAPLVAKTLAGRVAKSGIGGAIAGAMTEGLRQAVQGKPISEENLLIIAQAGLDSAADLMALHAGVETGGAAISTVWPIVKETLRTAYYRHAPEALVNRGARGLPAIIPDEEVAAWYKELDFKEKRKILRENAQVGKIISQEIESRMETDPTTRAAVERDIAIQQGAVKPSVSPIAESTPKAAVVPAPEQIVSSAPPEAVTPQVYRDGKGWWRVEGSEGKFSSEKAAQKAVGVMARAAALAETPPVEALPPIPTPTPPGIVPPAAAGEVDNEGIFLKGQIIPDKLEGASAIKMKDGTIYYDKGASSHWQIVENQGLSYDDVVGSGNIIGGQYKESGERPYIIREKGQGAKEATAKRPAAGEAAPEVKTSSEAKAKEPWEMSKEEFKEAYQGSPYTNPNEKDSVINIARKDEISQALASGKSVPSEVLADYQDSADRYGKAAPTEEVPAKMREGLSEDVQQGMKDWLQNKAYLDNAGNYRLSETKKIAPWNKEVKKAFPNAEGINEAARQQFPEIEAYKKERKSGKFGWISKGKPFDIPALRAGAPEPTALTESKPQKPEGIIPGTPAYSKWQKELDSYNRQQALTKNLHSGGPGIPLNEPATLTSRTPLEKAQDNVRQYFSDRALEAAQGDAFLTRAGKFLSKLTDTEIRNWYKTDYAPAEKGNSIPIRSVDLLRNYKILHDPLERIIRVIKPTLGQIDNYHRHMFDTTGKGWQDFMARLSKGSILGKRGFLKHRKYMTMAEGLDQPHLNPRYRNPVDMLKADLAEKRQFVAGFKLLQRLKKDPDIGAKYVRGNQFAPEGYDFVDDSGFIARQWSDTEKAYIIRGRWAFPKKIANYLNGQLGKGLREAKFSSPIDLWRQGRYSEVAYNMLYNPLLYYRTLKVAGPFHFFVTSNHFQAIAEAMALMNGETQSGAKRLGQATVNLIPLYKAVRAAREGYKIAKEGILPGSFPQYREAAANIIEGGGRISHDDRRLGEILTDAFRDAAFALKKRKPFRALGEILTLVGRPIMHDFVANVKPHAHMLVTESEIAALNKKYGVGTQQYPTGAALPSPLREEYEAGHFEINRRAWDFIDHTFGQMVRENIPLSNTIKDLLAAGTNFPTWNIGNLMLYKNIGSGGYKAGAGKGINLNEKLSINLFVGLLITLGIHGALVHRITTGEWPGTLKDIYFPIIGKKTEERGNEASYLKTAVAWGTHPVKSVTGMMSGILTMIEELINNKDWQSIRIRDPKSSVLKQMGDLVKWQYGHWQPIAASQAYRGRSMVGKYGQFFGWSPTPRYIGNTAALQAMNDYLSNLGKKISTPEEAERRRDIMAAVDMGRRGNKEGMAAEIKKLTPKYGLNTREIFNLYKQVGMPDIQYRLSHISLDAALDAWDVATPQEKKLMASLIATNSKGQDTSLMLDKIVNLAKTNPSRYALMQNKISKALPEIIKTAQGQIPKEKQSLLGLPVELRKKHGVR